MRLSERGVVCIILTGWALHSILFYIDNRSPEVMTNSVDIFYINELLKGFKESLFSGHLYPRWLGSVLNGGGAPVFVYYPPLAFYISAVLTFFFSSDIASLAFTQGAGLALLSFTTFFWLKRHIDTDTAGWIAIFLLIVPFHALEMHGRAELSQIWAQGMAPLGFYFAERWREEEKGGYLAAFTLLFALMCLTHPPTFLLFAPVCCLYGCLWRSFSLTQLFFFISAITLSVGITSFYWLPAELNQHLIKSDFFYYFLATPSRKSIFDPVPHLLMGLPFLVPVYIAWRVTPQPVTPPGTYPPRTIIIAFTLLICLIIFLLFPASRVIWSSFFPMHIVQGPFRLIQLMMGLTPVFLWWISARMQRKAFAVFLFAVFLAAIPALSLYAKERTRSAGTSDAIRLYTKVQFIPEEYQVKWLPPYGLEPDYFVTYDAIPPAAAVDGQASVQIEEKSDERIMLHVEAGTPATIELRQHYFPAWQATAESDVLRVYPSDRGLIRIGVPKGISKVIIMFMRPIGTTAGYGLSLASLLLMGLLLLASRQHRLKKGVR